MLYAGLMSSNYPLPGMKDSARRHRMTMIFS
ncbi:Uncharacterised protein [Klebsiella michiganensis]|uniref:Uncharacterized protein n=1 Tax=Klebsiella michiganensis TaxID=1134687 RepID=A0A7H4N5P4_9ENTR|nr:Uncharacterised protein [Klebsiella michiganensis]